MRRSSAASLEMIKRPIAFVTTSRDFNLALIGQPCDHPAKLGVPPEVFFDDRSKNANRFATLGAPGDGGAILSRHCDVGGYFVCLLVRQAMADA